MSADYPKKYWWLILIVVPLAIAVIGILPQFQTKDETDSITISNTEFSGDLHFNNMGVIIKEFTKMTGNSITDPQLLTLLKKGVNLVIGKEYEAALPLFQEISKQVDLPSVYNNLGALYASTGRYAEARKSYQHAIAQNPTDQEVQYNLGLLKYREGDVEEAKSHLKEASNIGTATDIVRKIENQKEEGKREREPNNEFKHASTIALGKDIEGAITEPSDSDFFVFDTPPTHRDMLEIRLQNHTDTYRPYLAIYNSQKNEFWHQGADNQGQDLSYRFPAIPNGKYYVYVGQWSNTAGQYALQVSPLKQFDGFEPNEDLQTAAQLSIGKEAEANIMDPGDQDYFHFETSSNPGKVTLTLRNQSTTLRPYLAVYNGVKKEFWHTGADNAGQDLRYEFEPAPNEQYYVYVGQWSNTQGPYRLAVEHQ